MYTGSVKTENVISEDVTWQKKDPCKVCQNKKDKKHTNFGYSHGTW